MKQKSCCVAEMERLTRDKEGGHLLPLHTNKSREWTSCIFIDTILRMHEAEELQSC